jgi:hypothetical protein
VAPFWIVSGEATCPAASGAIAHLAIPMTGPSYVPPGDPLGSITLHPATTPQSCPLIGIFGHVDLMTLPTATLSVSTAGAGSGNVSSDPPVIDCGATCVADFGRYDGDADRDTHGGLHAGWNGACTGASRTVTLENHPSERDLPAPGAGDILRAIVAAPVHGVIRRLPACLRRRLGAPSRECPHHPDGHGLRG